MRIHVFDQYCNRLAIRDLRLAHFDFNAMRPFQDVDLDVEVQLAHTLEQRLARVFVSRNVKGWVFLNHLVQCNAHLFSSCLVLRVDRN